MFCGAASPAMLPAANPPISGCLANCLPLLPTCPPPWQVSALAGPQRAAQRALRQGGGALGGGAGAQPAAPRGLVQVSRRAGGVEMLGWWQDALCSISGVADMPSKLGPCSPAALLPPQLTCPPFTAPRPAAWATATSRKRTTQRRCRWGGTAGRAATHWTELGGTLRLAEEGLGTV